MPHYVPQFINSMVTERALAFEAKELGFKVSDEDLAAGIRQTIPQLFQDGKFAGKDAYAQVLAQQNMTIPQFESDMARQLLVTKMRNVALEGTVVTPQEIEQEYPAPQRQSQDPVREDHGRQVSRGSALTPDELRKYYEANKPDLSGSREARSRHRRSSIRPRSSRPFNPPTPTCCASITTTKTATASQSASTSGTSC